MRLTAILLFAVCLHVSARGYSQQKITLSEKDATLDKVFKDIQKQTDYYFSYREDILSNSKKVNLDVHGMSLDDVLRLCFKDQPLTYSIVANSIVVKAKVPDENVSATPPPTTEIHGTIVGEDGVPIPDATITIKGTKMSFSADGKGLFILKNLDENSILIISSIGYEPITVPLKGRTDFRFSLKRKIGQLDETQIIGYGTTTQRFSVGSETKVSAADIASQPITNPLQALEGRVAGLTVSQSTGIPGASMTIQVEGQNSLRQNLNYTGPAVFDNPLFIIDGVPFAPQNANLQQSNSLVSGNSISSSIIPGYPGAGPFSTINPSDIESIEVLRDADATAIYGSRGANGVILITTKRGKPGKAKLDINVYSGASNATRLMPMMNTQEYLKMRHQAFINDGLQPSADEDPDLLVFDTTRYMNWQKYFMGGTSNATDVDATLSGGSATTQFLLGSSYHHEGYIYPGGYSYDRASVHGNIHHVSENKRLTLDWSNTYTYDQNTSSGNYQLAWAFNAPPDYPALSNPNGSINWNYNGTDLSTNPLGYMRQPYSMKNYNLLSDLKIDYMILPGLTIGSNFGYNTVNSNEYSATPIASQDPIYGFLGSAVFGSNNFMTWIMEPQAAYRRRIGKGKLELLTGGTFQKNTNDLTNIEGSNYQNDRLLGSISSAPSVITTGSSSEYKYNAVFGKINYIWDSKYIVDFTGRRDGSSRFGPGRQFGDFGSAGAGWIFSEESFARDHLNFLSYGKLRASYGTTGNDAIGNYQYLSSYSTPGSGFTYQGSAGYVPTSLYNPNYSWGVTKKLEVGLELGFLKDQILAQASYYRNESGNQLVYYTLPAFTGFSSVLQNAPYTVRNQGLQLQLTTQNIKNRNFGWTTAFNLTIPHNILASFPHIATSSYASIYVVGKSLTVINAFKYLGLNDTTGLYQFQDLNKDGVLNPTTPSAGGDFQTFGNLDPKFYGGLNNTFSYRGFELDVFVQFTKQTGTNYIAQVYNMGPAGIADNNLPKIFNNTWTGPGQKTDLEKLTTTYADAFTAAVNYITSSAAYTDASFIRFKTCSLSYTIPLEHTKHMKIQGCKIYVNAQNLFTITGYKGNDPETQSFYSLPPLRTVVAGLQLSL